MAHADPSHCGVGTGWRVGLGALLACGGFALLAGSGSWAQSPGQEAPGPGPAPLADAASAPIPKGASMAAEMQATIQVALRAASQRTGLDRAMLTVVSVQAVTWPDGALGCPSPGRMYTQGQVPGYRIRIQAGQQTLEYHANARRYLVLCSSDGPFNARPDPRH